MRVYKFHIFWSLLVGCFLYADKIYFHFFYAFPKFVYNQLSDFLWMFAFSNWIILIWKHDTHSYFYLMGLLLLGVLLEVFQKWKFIQGTFDWLDILAYSIAFLISLLIIKSLQLKSQKHD